MAVKKNARVPRKRQHSRPIERIVKNELPVKKIKKRKALVIAQEIKFARLLASNDKRIREKMLKNLKKWLTVRSESSFAFTEADFMRLWKGLFYCMWMSDKPLIQEELAESLGNIVHCFNSLDTALLYAKCTLKTLAVEWFGIDRYRLDKFQMLVRRILRHIFEMCHKRSWDEKWTKGVAGVIETLLLDAKTTLGFSLHITEIFMEELAKIGDGTILPDHVTELTRPFAVHLAVMEDERQIRHVMKHIFRYLIFQSDVGMDYMEKFEAWRQAGFPCENVDEMEKIELSDQESENEDEITENDDVKFSGPKALDPRAGRVDVDLPQLPFDPSAIAELIKSYKFHPKSTAKTRKQITRLIREFSELANGNMPLGVKNVILPHRKNSETNPKKAALRLLKFEKELYSDIRKKRKRKLVAPIIEANERLENLLMPLNPDDELTTNGFEIANEDIEVEQSENEAELKESSNKFNISSKKIKKKSIKKTTGQTKMTDLTEKITQKKQEQQKIKGERTNTILAEKLDNGTEFAAGKKIKYKSKKSKTKKFQNAINYLNQKLLNRHCHDGTPSKVKKLRRSIEAAWDVSQNVDPPTPTLSPKSKLANTLPPMKMETNDTCEKIIKLSSNSPVKSSLNKTPWLLPVITKLEDEKPKVQTPERTQLEGQSGSSAKKRVKIMLKCNTAQHTSEYMRQLRQSPAIPYDANKKPLAGVLKPSPLSSPVNPFYQKA